MRSGPVYILLQGIPCELTEAQLRDMAQGAHGLERVLIYNPYDPGFAVFVFRNKTGSRVPVRLLPVRLVPCAETMRACTHT